MREEERMFRRSRTKIVATIGPATSTAESVEALIVAGVSVFRLNYSHGERRDHERMVGIIREVSERQGFAIGILQDLQGPKLRVGELADDRPVRLEDGESFRICTREIIGTSDMVSTSYDGLGHDLAIGDPVLLDDGRLKLEVTGIELGTDVGDIVTTRVVRGGALSARKGINLPETEVSAPALTEKDREDLRAGIDLGVDMVALSFVRRPEDLQEARRLIQDRGGTQPLIAKIEKPHAVTMLPEIIATSDGVMVARGDLGVELSPEAVPLIQKRIIRLANAAGKPVITATQMLESMISAPHPTRAEASDVANAILDGTDAVMLSGETAVGKYPVETVETMASIARTVEHERMGTPWQINRVGIRQYENQTESQAVGHAARALADDLKAKAIVVLTRTGGTARDVSRERPVEPTVAITDQVEVGRRLALWHGVIPVITPLETTIDDLIAQVDRVMIEREFATVGDRIVIVGANPHRTAHPSIFLEVHTISG
jgi:pyruvate kinase